MSKRNLAQTEIPVGNEIGRKHDPDVEARRCTCGSAFPDKWGARWKHKPPCPRAGRKF